MQEMMKRMTCPKRAIIACLFVFLFKLIQRRRRRQLEELQILEQQRQWQRSLEHTTQEAGLAAGYNQAHFNVME